MSVADHDPTRPSRGNQPTDDWTQLADPGVGAAGGSGAGAHGPGNTDDAITRADRDRPPERIGPYRVVGEVGRGGMGSVLLAVRQDDQFKKRVAIKLLRRGVDTADILKRFQLERQVLGALNHPNIARLLDGGETDDRLPFLVMEYIEGRPIDKYCDAENLTIDERLNIFRKVCGAVHFAHQNLIVHRDLKPSNILIGRDGEPKLLDFGIAKLLNPEMMAITLATGPELRLMTPEYASPEQVRGEPIGTTSDVYSLGVLLYELLTGRRPYRFATRLHHEVVRVISEVEPERPSDAVTQNVELNRGDAASKIVTPVEVARARSGQPARLRRKLIGDLDNIVLKAMQKVPRRRYGSAEELSDDVRRHLEGLPVAARPDTLAYRLTKFVNRHRGLVGAMAAVVLSLAGGLVATTIYARQAAHERNLARQEQVRADAERTRADQQKQIAEARFAETRGVLRKFLTEFQDKVRKLPGATAARGVLADSALAVLAEMLSHARDDPELLHDIAMAYDDVGDVQGGEESGPNRGDAEGAARSFEKALEIRRKLAAARPENRELQLELAASCVKLADRRAPSRESIQADALYRESESITRRLVATLPGDRESRSQLAVALVKRGDFLRTGGDAEGGLRLFEESLALREEVLREHPGDIRAARDASVAHLKIGRAVLDAGQARSIEIARQHIARALELRRGLLQREPETARAQRDVLEAQKALADLLVSEKQWSQVQPLLAQAVEQARQLRLADSADARGLYDLADICGMAGDAALKADDKNQARTYYDEAMKAAREYLATDPAAAKPRYAAATAAGRMARLCDALSRRDDAARWWLEALEHIDAATKAAPANELLRVEKQRIQAEVDRLEGGSGA